MASRSQCSEQFVSETRFRLVAPPVVQARRACAFVSRRTLPRGRCRLTRVRPQHRLGCPSFGGQRTVGASRCVRKCKSSLVRLVLSRAHSRPCWLAAPSRRSSTRARVGPHRRMQMQQLTLRSSGRSPGYRGTPLNSNVGCFKSECECRGITAPRPSALFVAVVEGHGTK